MPRARQSQDTVGSLSSPWPLRRTSRCPPRLRPCGPPIQTGQPSTDAVSSRVLPLERQAKFREGGDPSPFRHMNRIEISSLERYYPSEGTLGNHHPHGADSDLVGLPDVMVQAGTHLATYFSSEAGR